MVFELKQELLLAPVGGLSVFEEASQLAPRYREVLVYRKDQPGWVVGDLKCMLASF